MGNDEMLLTLTLPPLPPSPAACRVSTPLTAPRLAWWMHAARPPLPDCVTTCCPSACLQDTHMGDPQHVALAPVGSSVQAGQAVAAVQWEGYKVWAGGGAGTP